jgi:hypothetical protein
MQPNLTSPPPKRGTANEEEICLVSSVRVTERAKKADMQQKKFILLTLQTKNLNSMIKVSDCRIGSLIKRSAV